jgi:excinuclease ABC subunit C
MIEEVVSRRIRRRVEENRPLADLMLIDGGKGQVRRAHAVLEQAGVSDRVAAIGIAKRHETLHPAHLKRAVRLPDQSPGLKLLRYVRDESHRFARLYHMLLRGKAFRE